MRFYFERCALDVGLRELSIDQEPVHLEPQVFDVLAHLVVNHDRLVPKTELLDEVWGDRFVSESALTSRIKSARRAIGDDGNEQRLIRTVRGHGYRFVGFVEAEAEQTVPIEPVTTRGHALAAIRTRLVGRSGDLGTVLRLIDENRLVTISGPGGAGKSSLALAAAHRVVERQDREAVLVELAPARDRATVVRTVAEAAGIEGAGATDLAALAAALGTRDVLLVVDNCEHLVADCADLVDAVLDAGDGPTVLATSREPLMVTGEAVHPLGSLGVHAPELFAQRAAAATGDPGSLQLDDPRVVELCERLDGLPLAIELAAAQLRHLTLDDLLERLDDRLRLLAGGRPRAGARHSALAATVAWSHELLDAPSRELFDLLGVFPASFDLASAGAVAGLDLQSVTATMADLVAKNLVVHDGARGRYHLLETIRLYATQRLEASERHPDAIERLRTHVVARAAAHPRHRNWVGSTVAAASHEDIDNVRLAFHASLAAGNLTDAVTIAVGVSPLWRNASSFAEGLRWAALLDEHDLSARDRLWLHIVEADLGLGSGDPKMLLEGAGEATELGRQLDEPEAVVVSTILASLLVGDPERAIGGLRQARTRASALGEPALERLARAFLVVPMLLGGRTEDLEAEVAAITSHPPSGGYDSYISNWAAWLTALAARDGDMLRQVMDAQLDNVRRSGLRENWLMTYCHVLTRIGEGGEYREQLRRFEQNARNEGRPTGADTVLVLAYDLACNDEFVGAAELLGASSTTLSRDTASFVHHLVIRDQVVAPRLEPDQFAAAMTRGQARTIEQVLAEYGV